MNVLIADKFEEAGIAELTRAGCNITYEPKLVDDALREAIARTRCVVLVVRSTKVTEPMLSASDALSVVVRAGAGYNTIDVAAASRRSILVANCPGKNAIAVAELTLGLILALDRRIAENVIDLRAGVWNKSEYDKARGLKGRTLGIIGLGQIGEAVARRAQAFDMNVCAWSRSLKEDRAKALNIARCATPEDVAAQSDVLTVHLAAASGTKGLVGAKVLEQLRPGSFFINTARADVVDYVALTKVIADRGIRAALDVFPDEPSSGTGTFSPSIVKAAGVVYGTHHIGASTEQAQTAIADETVRIIKVYLRSGRVENCVNLSEKSRARYVIVVRHRNQPGVLAHILNEISHAGVNVEEMENVICAGGEAACAQIKLESQLTDEMLHRIGRGNEHILGISAFAVTE